MTIPLQRGIVYGPVNSRRLGLSLGINVLPTRQKVCSLNCLYCQYGWTKFHTRLLTQREFLPTVPEILRAVEESLQMVYPQPAYITFSGNGEPTLHPNFPELVAGVIRLRDRYAPSARTAVLSNSTRIDDARIRDAIEQLDMRIMKLDCGNGVCFQSFNRPAPGINFETIVHWLMAMRGITIQSLFTGGPQGNYSPDNIRDWINIVKEISPRAVQIYTLDRGYPAKSITPATPEMLKHLKKRLQSEGIEGEVY
ncbi:MAG: radical SAM protein [Calditrichia bacterium]